MSSVEDRLAKLREERYAREKARIEKLRELNLKKYNKNEPQQPPQKNSASNVPVANKSRSDSVANVKSCLSNVVNATKNNISNHVKNNFHVNGTTKRPISATLHRKTEVGKEGTAHQRVTAKNVAKDASNVNKLDSRPVNPTNQASSIPKVIEKKNTTMSNANKIVKKDVTTTNKVNDPIANRKSNIPCCSKTTEPMKQLARKSLAPKSLTSLPKPTFQSRKSIQPPKLDTKVTDTKESVFDRLYKPKMVTKKQPDDVTKLQTDPNYLKKVLKDSGLILNKRHTVFDVKPKAGPPVRRSISAVHFKRISKNEINNCIHKWSSIGEKIDKIHLMDVNEDESVKADKVISAVKSERKKVKFQTPVPSNFNTPRPEELQSRLKSWLQKRGKSLDSYHHLQCFGLHHIAHKVKPIVNVPQLELYDDEDKENIAVEHDSDNESFTENMNETEDLDRDLKAVLGVERDNWRQTSYMSDSGDLNETRDTVCSTVTSSDTLHQVDEVLMGALNDLTDLLKEGFDWEQSARWLRAIRDRFPRAADTPAYWECRAALEETRGDLPASVQCWEEAIAKGTERSVVEANLDQLLDKFMQLKISPNSGKRKRADPKMVDVKNVFKSTIIRFAVQQAKLRQSTEARYTATPVRRSARLSVHSAAKRTPRTPLQQVCTSLRRLEVPGPLLFVPNDKLCGTP